MRPIRLEIENLRSFKKKRVIAFERLQLFAIVGDTGAGKTSILEAITYALFNRSTWSGTNIKELISKGASTMAVTFVFSVDGDEFTITRISRDRGLSQHRLSCPSRGIDVASENEVKLEVRKALHFDASAFLHTVLLPQGKHAELLTSSGAERHKILGELFRLDEIPRVQEEAKYHEGRAEAYLDALNKERAQLPPEPAALVEGAQVTSNAALSRLEVVSGALARDKGLALIVLERQRALESIKRRLEQLHSIDEVPAKLGAIDAIDDDLRRAAIGHTDQLSAARASKVQAEAAADDLKQGAVDRESVRNYDVVLNRVEAASTEIAREEADLKEKARLSKDAAKKADELATQRKEVGARRDGTKEALSKAESQLAELRQAKEQLEGVNNIYQLALKARAGRESDLKAGAARLSSAGERLKVAESALGIAKEKQRQTAAAFEEAQRAGGAAALASHLHAGDDCPVCNRKLPSNYKAPKAPNLEMARRADGEAQKLLRAAEAEKIGLDSEIEVQLRTDAEGKKLLEQAKKDVTVAEKAVRKLLQHPGDDPDVVLKALNGKLSELSKRLPELRSRDEDAANKVQSIETSFATTLQQVAGLRESVDALAKSIARRKELRSKDVALLPAAFSPNSDGSAIDAARLAVKKALDEAIAVDEVLAAANASITAATAKLAEIERSRSFTVIAPRAALHERLDRIALLLEAPPKPADEIAQKAWASSTVAKTQKEVISLEVQSADEQRELQLSLDARLALVAELGAEPHEAFTVASIQLETANRNLLEAQRDLARVGEVSAKVQKLEPTRLGLQILREELGARRFAKYATEQRQKRLLEEGTMILKDMTSGRYAFTNDFQVWDYVTNEERPPQTLSGGEKFLASLALSLAVVEIAANAGARIESLFLDEGFASLDSETLEIAMMELRKCSRAGRSICVISHLREVTKFVSDTFLVKAREEGSEVQHIEGPLDDEADMIEGLVTQLTARA